jgi:hypothetical protein
VWDSDDVFIGDVFIDGAARHGIFFQGTCNRPVVRNPTVLNVSRETSGGFSAVAFGTAAVSTTPTVADVMAGSYAGMMQHVVSLAAAVSGATVLGCTGFGLTSGTVGGSAGIAAAKALHNNSNLDGFGELLSSPAIRVDANGAVRFGAAGVYDSRIERVSANVLRVVGVLTTSGGLGVGNSATASTLGTVTRRMEVFNSTGTSLGFVPIYNSIT